MKKNELTGWVLSKEKCCSLKNLHFEKRAQKLQNIYT